MVDMGLPEALGFAEERFNEIAHEILDYVKNFDTVDEILKEIERKEDWSLMEKMLGAYFLGILVGESDSEKED